MFLLQQFFVSGADVRFGAACFQMSAPQWIGYTHVTDQLADFQHDLRPAATAPRLPAPEQAETGATPTDSASGHRRYRARQTDIGPLQPCRRLGDVALLVHVKAVFSEMKSAYEERALAGHGASHGFQTGDDRGEKLATTARTKSVAEGRQRCNIPRRNRRRVREEIRRLIHAVT